MENPSNLYVGAWVQPKMDALSLSGLGVGVGVGAVAIGQKARGSPGTPTSTPTPSSTTATTTASTTASSAQEKEQMEPSASPASLSERPGPPQTPVAFVQKQVVAKMCSALPFKPLPASEVHTHTDSSIKGEWNALSRDSVKALIRPNVQVGSQTFNYHKERYRQIFTADDTRVRLSPLFDPSSPSSPIPGSDYIAANFIFRPIITSSSSSSSTPSSSLSLSLPSPSFIPPSSSSTLFPSSLFDLPPAPSSPRSLSSPSIGPTLSAIPQVPLLNTGASFPSPFSSPLPSFPSPTAISPVSTPPQLRLPDESTPKKPTETLKVSSGGGEAFSFPKLPDFGQTLAPLGLALPDQQAWIPMGTPRPDSVQYKVEEISTEPLFIATQAPLPHTTADFWRMVWEQESRIVVMHTKLNESNRIKANRYWPSLRPLRLSDYGSPDYDLESEETDFDCHTSTFDPSLYSVPYKTYGHLRVRCLSKRTENEIIIRKFLITPVKPSPISTPNSSSSPSSSSTSSSAQETSSSSSSSSSVIPPVHLKTDYEKKKDDPADRSAQEGQGDWTQAQPAAKPKGRLRALSKLRFKSKTLSRSKGRTSRDPSCVLSKSQSQPVLDMSNDQHHQLNRQHVAKTSSLTSSVQDTSTLDMHLAYCSSPPSLPSSTSSSSPTSPSQSASSPVSPVSSESSSSSSAQDQSSLGEGQSTISCEEEDKETEGRTIVHIQYTGWPDHSAPNRVNSIISLLTAMEKHTRAFRASEANLGPPIVHCSAGIGRTGTFCAILLELQRYVESERLDQHLQHSFHIPLTIQFLRTQRRDMVMDESQYLFCYQVVRSLLRLPRLLLRLRRLSDLSSSGSFFSGRTSDSLPSPPSAFLYDESEVLSHPLLEESSTVTDESSDYGFDDDFEQYDIIDGDEYYDDDDDEYYYYYDGEDDEEDEEEDEEEEDAEEGDVGQRDLVKTCGLSLSEPLVNSSLEPKNETDAL